MSLDINEICNKEYNDQDVYVNRHAFPSTGTSAPSDEQRITDPLTGGQKGTKLARFSLIPSEFLWALAEHFGIGASKYADRNWEKGYAWSLCADALDRHWHAWKLGEMYDPETRSHHLIAVAWHACALFIFEIRNIGTNDIRVK